MSKYCILGQDIEFTESEERYLSIQRDKICDLYNTRIHFNEFYSQCGNIETVLKNYSDELVEILGPIMGKHFESLVNKEIYDISYDQYADNIPDDGSIDNAYDTILEQYANIEGNKEAAYEMRSERKASRGRYVGGGYGVGGSLSGMAAAGVLNAGSGLAHSATNLVGNTLTAINASIEKSSLYNNKNTKQTLLYGIIAVVRDEYDYYENTLSSKLGEEYLANRFNQTTSSTYLQNAALLADDKDSKRQELLVQSVALYPVGNDSYEEIVKRYGDEDNSVQLMAEKNAPYTTIYELKTTLIEDEINNIDFSAKENIKNALENISKICKWYGVPDTEYINALNSIIEAYETAELTVDDVCYKTLEQAENVHKEINCIKESLSENAVNDEQAMLELKNKIENEFSLLSKDKYINFLNKELAEYDLNYRTVNEVEFESRESADRERESINELASVIQHPCITSAEGISELKKKIEDIPEPVTVSKDKYIMLCDRMAEIWEETENLYNSFNESTFSSRAARTDFFYKVETVMKALKIHNIENCQFMDFFELKLKAFNTVEDRTYDNVVKATDAYYSCLESARKYEAYLKKKNEHEEKKKKSIFSKIGMSIQGAVNNFFNESCYKYLTKNGTVSLPEDNRNEWSKNDYDKYLLLEANEKIYNMEMSELMKTATIKVLNADTSGLFIPDKAVTKEFITDRLKQTMNNVDYKFSE